MVKKTLRHFAQPLVTQHLKKEVRTEAAVQVPVRDDAPTLRFGNELADAAAARFSESFSVAMVQVVAGIAVFRRDKSETSQRTFASSGIEMNADDAGGIGTIRNRSTLDEVKVAVVFPRHEDTDFLPA